MSFIERVVYLGGLTLGFRVYDIEWLSRVSHKACYSMGGNRVNEIYVYLVSLEKTRCDFDPPKYAWLREMRRDR